jgi:3-dehydroquinate dehydratase/shikimate dehydrogenase
MIFLVLAGKTLEENLEAVGRYKDFIDGVEIRADYLADPLAEDWGRFFRDVTFPAILTIRKTGDGGLWNGTETERGDLFLRLIAAGSFSFVDLEENADLPDVEAAAAGKNITIIRSFHDFAGVPANLAERVAALPRSEGEIPKAAVMPWSCEDLERIIDAFAVLRGRRMILLGMGEFGFPTRVLAPKLGSFLTFASPGGAQTAPGLIDPETLHRVYRYHKIGPATRIFGIIGNPILHSRSPHIHNPAYDKLGIDAVYVPFHVDGAAEFLPIIDKLHIEGLSVTVPFKEDVLPFCRRVEDAVRVIGACNTLVPGPEGLSGFNTDAEGFLAPLRGLFTGISSSVPGAAIFPAGLKAAVVGAGGAARSVVFALARAGTELLILNRTAERAERLAEDIEKALELGPGRIRWAALDAAGISEIAGYRDLIVNTTTMGMHPWQDRDPLEAYDFTGEEIVYDIVYNPRETLLLKRALRAGCRVVFGDAMLLAQACRQFLLFTGREYPG